MSGTTPADHLKCRYCTWITAKWLTKNGKRTSGWSRLEAHLEDAHGIIAKLSSTSEDD
jgi:hypothetical protein